MQKELEEIRTRFEREYFESCEKSNGELKNTYALWLEREVVKKLNYIPCCKGESEQLCDGLHSTDFMGKCFKCGKQVFVREDKKA